MAASSITTEIALKAPTWSRDSRRHAKELIGISLRMMLAEPVQADKCINRSQALQCQFTIHVFGDIKSRSLQRHSLYLDLHSSERALGYIETSHRHPGHSPPKAARHAPRQSSGDTAKPIPIPFSFVVTNASKILSGSFTPGPLSITCMTISF